jgi:hypothetical protein
VGAEKMENEMTSQITHFGVPVEGIKITEGFCIHYRTDWGTLKKSCALGLSTDMAFDKDLRPFPRHFLPCGPEAAVQCSHKETEKGRVKSMSAAS